MGIKIEKVTVKNLGPIENFSNDFGLFNLIFSKNECGKTFLTEFIIQSLFKNIKRWLFRERGAGKVFVSGLSVSGLSDDKIVEFYPDCPKKLEDYWEADDKGLPPSIVNLLVSKGAEPEIDSSDEGIGKSLIKEIFSGISLLDKIDSDNNISKTIKQARLEDGNIIISNTGEGKTYRQLQEELSRIDNLFSEIELKYSRGVVESLGIEEKIIKEHLDSLYRAKCYEACLVSENIKDLNKKLQQNNEDELNKLSSSVSIYESTKSQCNSLLSKHDEFNEISKHYEWLKEAFSKYQELSMLPVKKPGIITAIAAGIFAAAAVLFSILNISIGTIASIATAAGLAVFYIIKLIHSIKNAGLNEELNNLKKEFKKRIGSELTDIALLKIELERQREAFEKTEYLSEQLEELKSKNQTSKDLIQRALYSLTGSQQAEEWQWHSLINEKKTENSELKAKIEDLQKELVYLAVREAEYLKENPGVKFSYDEYEKLQSELDKIQQMIEEKKDEIDKLKYGICSITNDDTSIDWEALLGHLRDKRSEKQNELECCAAKISAGIIIHGLIAELRQDEDKKILEGLQSDIVLKSLQDLTKNYCRLYLEDDKLIVSDNYRNFYLKELSTGAREQIMLALRIGFSAKILNQDSLFLILDDAFQHSDWDRRKILVSKLAGIAQKGWQIIYLTMDNNIRDLFEKAGAKFGKGQYKYFELKG
ncbi:MAG: hypothetical protein FJW61_02630 [Actinobacteria bacterium]|nr:hypothetical protein [Actinomycetota bacterium]